MKLLRASFVLLTCFIMFAGDAYAAQMYVPPTDDTGTVGQSYCPNLLLTLKRGMRDANTNGEVSELQSFIVDYYDLGTQDVIGGFFGRLTQSYVQRFQKEQGLPAYGIVGSLTRARIAEVCKHDIGQQGYVCPTFQRLLCANDQIYVSGSKDSHGCDTQGYCSQKPIVTPTQPTATCKVWFDGCNTCSRSFVGGNLACTRMACVMGFQTGQEPKAYCKEYFSTTNDLNPPSITAFSGPVKLQVNEQGTWRVEANDREGGVLSYSVDWGDVIGSSTTSGQIARTEIITQQTTFSHSYATAGVYTVQITVRDNASNAVTSSATVQIGGGTLSCTADYSPVCGERQVCSGSSCWSEKKTFSNACNLGLENATYLYNGECQGTIGGYVPPATCKTWYDGCNTCSRTVQDGAGMCTLRACVTTTNGYCSEYFVDTIGPLAVTPINGVAPVTVSVTGPSQLLKKIQGGGVNSGFGGCGYTVTWGDGSTSPATGASCASGLSHTYTTSEIGTKTVQATLWHPGPTDASIVDWKGASHVVVGSAQGAYLSPKWQMGNALQTIQFFINSLVK